MQMVGEICIGCLQNTLFCLHTPGTVWLSLPHLKSNWDIKQEKKMLRATSSLLDISLLHSLEHENWYFLLCKLSISRRSICIRGGSLWAVSPVLVVFLLKSSTPVGTVHPTGEPLPFSLTAIDSSYPPSVPLYCLCFSSCSLISIVCFPICTVLFPSVPGLHLMFKWAQAPGEQLK